MRGSTDNSLGFNVTSVRCLYYYFIMRMDCVLKWRCFDLIY